MQLSGIQRQEIRDMKLEPLERLIAAQMGSSSPEYTTEDSTFIVSIYRDKLAELYY